MSTTASARTTSFSQPSASEALGGVVQQLERGETSALEAIEALLADELGWRGGRRVEAALRMARPGAVETLDGFDFSFQPSLDRGRVQALAQLGFVDRREVLHSLGPPGTGGSHLAVALGVEAIRAGRGVHFMTLADPVTALWPIRSPRSPAPNGTGARASASASCAARDC